MAGDDVRVEGRVIPGGEVYKDEYVIEKILGEPPVEHRTELWRGHKGDLFDLYYAAEDLIKREVDDGV